MMKLRNLVFPCILVSLMAVTNGCFLAAAGIVEASRSEATTDPMGTEYQGPRGDIGWYQPTQTPSKAP